MAETNKFKVGDRVRILAHDTRSWSGGSYKGETCWSPRGKPGCQDHKRTVGAIGVVDKVDEDGVCDVDTDDGDYLGLYAPHELELVETGPKVEISGSLTLEDMQKTYSSIYAEWEKYYPTYYDDPGPTRPRKYMAKLSLMAKKLLDADTRALVKAEILDSELNVINSEFVLSFIVNQNKAELAKEARKMLKEQKEDNE